MYEIYLEITMSKTLNLAQELINIPSVTPNDHGCQMKLVELLKPLGFTCKTIQSKLVTNLWARKGLTAPLLVFAGHTDVVPVGNIKQWTFPPFQATQHHGKLYGRGTADMKTSIAAMLVACDEFIVTHPNHNGSIGFLITSDEEGSAKDGTVVVCRYLKARAEYIDYCVIGEPTSITKLGDTIKNGRRGSMSGALTIQGQQGHIAYPHLAKNPIHLAIPALEKLISETWDTGTAYYQPTSYQISRIKSGIKVSNIIPSTAIVNFNFRFSTANTVTNLKQRVCDILDKHKLNYHITWQIHGLPFLTKKGNLSDALSRAIKIETNLDTNFSTSGGTSDGRFIAQICPQVIEFGPLNNTIHKVDEHINICDINPLKNIYKHVLEHLLL